MKELMQAINDLEKVASRVNIDKEVNTKEMKELEDVCNNIDIDEILKVLE